jgi:hypothetical protein
VSLQLGAVYSRSKQVCHQSVFYSMVIALSATIPEVCTALLHLSLCFGYVNCDCAMPVLVGRRVIIIIIIIIIIINRARCQLAHLGNLDLKRWKSLRQPSPQRTQRCEI